MTYNMSYNLERNEGTVVVNLSLLEAASFAKAIPLMSRVYEKGLAMGSLIAVFEPGEQVSGYEIPDGFVGIGTVCSITINGILLSAGIPVTSRFGGLLEMRDGKATRFIQIINYDGTSIDPLEIFIKSGMTDYIGATSTGNGQIGASFREFPAASHDAVEEIERRLEKVGMGAIMTLGMPGQTVLEIPVSEGHIGAVVIGGLNPVAILEESGIEVWCKALSGHVDFKRLFPYTALAERVGSIV
jgi:repressor of nif and glnA expression